MAEHVLPVFLADIGHVAAALDDTGPAGEILGVGEQPAPLRLQQVDDAQVLAPLLELSARGGQEVHVRVARPPSFRRHVGHAPNPQRQLPLARLDPHRLPQRLVFEPARDVHDDVASRQPALAGAVDIRVAALAQPDVAADVVVPAAEILRDVIVVAVRLVGNPLGRAEVDPARHRPPGRVVDDADMHPVAAVFRQLERDLAGVRPPVAFHVAPAHPAEFVAAPPDRDGSRRQRGDRRIRGRSLGRSPASPVVLAGQRLRVGRDAPVHVDVEDPVPPVLRHEPDRARWLADERVLINVAGRDAGDDEPRAARDELDPFDQLGPDEDSPSTTGSTRRAIPCRAPPGAPRLLPTCPRTGEGCSRWYR